MNREIKFRYVFKRKSDGHIYIIETKIEGLEETSINGLKSMFKNGLWELIARDQFTGLLDKNGKEIYEGDILSPSLREVLWRKGEYGDGDGWYTESHKLKTGYWSLSKTQTENSEIIGNIYENKELLG